MAVKDGIDTAKQLAIANSFAFFEKQVGTLAGAANEFTRETCSFVENLPNEAILKLNQSVTK